MNITLTIKLSVSLLAGVLILIVSRLLDYIVAAYLIVVRIAFCIRRTECIARVASVW